jgi:ribonuclease Z
MCKMVEIIFLGSGGSIPTEERRHPAILLRHEAYNILLDAGESVQMRMEPYGINRKMTIFCSHIHPDHTLGIAGLLLRFSLLGRLKPLDIFGPKDLIPWVQMAQNSIHLGTTFPTTVYGIEGGYEWTQGNATVRSFEVSHKGMALGYEFSSARPTGKFLPERAKELEIPKGTLWGKLAAGETVTLEDGTEVEPQDVTLPPEKGIRVVYSGDTRPCDNVRTAAKGADVLIHEAMYTEEHAKLADERGHSTARQAAEIAADARTRLLVLTHYSPRYENGDKILQEAKELFENVIVARDLMHITLSYKGDLQVSYHDELAK